MSKAMPVKKKTEATTKSSTESSSGSTSDSSTSSTSSSGSDSTSSSDSESSSSQASSGKRPPTVDEKKQPSTSTTTTVSKSHRKSTDGGTSSKSSSQAASTVSSGRSTNANNDKACTAVNASKIRNVALAKAKQPANNNSSTIKAYSSDDEDISPKKPAPAPSNKAPPRRKSIPKPKSNATVTPKPAPMKPTGGGKVPPKSNPAAAKNKCQTGKEPPKTAKAKAAAAAAAKIDANKKKSIFSPENSSESDDDDDSMNVSRLKTTPSANATLTKSPQKSNTASVPKPKVKATAKPLNDKPNNSSAVQHHHQQGPSKTSSSPEKPTRAKVVEVKSKPIVSSASSTSSSAVSSSGSDSDSSPDDSNQSSGNKGKQSIPRKIAKKMSPKDANSDSEADDKNSSNNTSKTGNKPGTRKSTRSANTRKSKHVQGKQNAYSDSESDTASTKRSLSRSPVKRAPVVTAKAKRNDVKAVRPNEIVVLEERKCPVDGCDSEGHLGGRQDKHFTIDACPMYYNMTPAKCRENYQDRKRREEIRRKVIESSRRLEKGQSQSGPILPISQQQQPAPTMEQKAYAARIRDARARFRPSEVDDLFDKKKERDRDKENAKDPNKEPPQPDKSRQPELAHFVPDYDLKLFRDAQALASEKIEEDLQTQPNTKGTKYIEMGRFEMEVWYQSPYPEEYARLPKLYICEYCLRYMGGRTVLQRHAAKCVWRHPPGEEVYRKEKISVWEVDGKRYKQYCQNLCLLAKFFLDHKTLYYDVEPFLFYVMTMLDNEGCHTVGYFSKEKNSFLNYNVSCILTLPPYQRQGYGRLLIDFSYLLTRVEGKIGSPEKPLSDLGLISYRSYWKDVLLGYLCSRAGTQLSVKDISQEMAIHSYDIVSTLQALGMMKYWKGKHIILKKPDVLDEYVERVKRRGSLLKEVDPDCLRWTPFCPPQANPS